MTKTPSATKTRQAEVPVEDLLKRLVLTGADIVRIGEDAELLVGGKNYNTALISRVEGVRIPQFRAISSVAFHIVLDECKVCAALIRSMVDEAYNRIDWASPEVTKDHEFLPKFVRSVAAEIRKASEADPELPHIRLRTFVNNVVDGFASSQESCPAPCPNASTRPSVPPTATSAPKRRKATCPWPCVPPPPVRTPARKPSRAFRTPS